MRGRLPRERPHSTLRAEHATLRLQQHEREIVAAKTRVQARRTRRVEALDGNAVRLQGVLRRRLPPVLAVGKPGEATLQQQGLAGLLLELAPERPRSARHDGVLGF